MSIATVARVTGAVYLLYFATAIGGALLPQAPAARVDFPPMPRPVNRTLALVMAFLSLAGSAVTAGASLFQLAPLVVLGDHSFLSGFDGRQLQALALLFIYLGAESGRVALGFFGFFQLKARWWLQPQRCWVLRPRRRRRCG